MPVVALDRVTSAFGHLPLLAEASLQIEAGERVSVIGRNGAGKTTLLRLLSGEQRPDAGTRWVQPGIRVARLEQDVPLTFDGTVFEAVAQGLGHLSALVSAYHHATSEVARDATPASLDRLSRLQHELEEQDGWRVEQRVEAVLARLDLPADAQVQSLSGGWRRRVLLARSLVAQPELLLLDEPTNHLDIDAIAWLETFLLDYPGAVVFVTHDRSFLQRLATRIVELDRGILSSWPGDYATFLRRREDALASEAIQQEKFDKKLAEEEVWLRRGVKARRTRDEGRVRALLAMRAERAERRASVGQVRLEMAEGETSGRMVFEARHVTFAYGDRVVVRDFSARVMRGDRIGLIGPNGSGKTTLLRLVLGDLVPDSGTVRQGASVQVAYFDQQREQLDPERTVVDTLGDGNDVVTVNGETRHVIGYLKDFLFAPERAQSPVKALSGGERNRLLLARLFTRPANVLVLDEPTNDLDLETLELLEAQLVAWPGTLLLVSHDRTFLDNVVTSTFAFEGEGRVGEYVGGYEDWRRQHDAQGPRGGGEASAPHNSGLSAVRVAGTSAPHNGLPHAAGDHSTAAPRRKLSFNEQRELEALPARIEVLEAERSALHAAIAAPEFYKEPSGEIAAQLARVEALDRELHAAYARWDELDSRAAAARS